MNFIEAFKEGKQGLNFGLTTGIPKLDRAINGIQKKMSIGLAAAPKCGKTTLADFGFVISPYLQILEMEADRVKHIRATWAKKTNEVDWEAKMNKEIADDSWLDNIEWIYFSFEIDRVSKEFKFASYFMAHDYNIYDVEHKGVKYQMSMDYLMGKQMHKLPDGKNELVLVKPEHEELLKVIYRTRIIPLFGEYDKYGKQIKKGKIDFIEEAENPTGIDKYLRSYARKNGEFVTQSYTVVNEKREVENKTRIIGYNPKRPKKFTIIITDHVRKPLLERNFNKKQTIDKLLEYHTILRNICRFTFVDICHSNRDIANIERLKVAGEYIFPTSDDVKDTGNLAEESTVMITMFNPNDEKYNLERHFGHVLEDHPNYRSIHVTESRNTPSPQHVFVNMYGNINNFTDLDLY